MFSRSGRFTPNRNNSPFSLTVEMGVTKSMIQNQCYKFEGNILFLPGIETGSPSHEARTSSLRTRSNPGSLSCKWHTLYPSSSMTVCYPPNITRPHAVPSFRPLRRFYFPSANFFFMNPTKKEKTWWCVCHRTWESFQRFATKSVTLIFKGTTDSPTKCAELLTIDRTIYLLPSLHS
jgi:hypothetical protein